jgi:hypothetical protein
MYTGQEVFEQSISIIDELNTSGIVDPTQVKEYSSRAPFLLDLWQKEMAKSGDLYKTFEISCFRKQNLLGDLNSFDAVEHISTDQTYQCIGGKCFHFGVDSQATVYIEELIGGTWQNVAGTFMTNAIPSTVFNGSISATSTESFTYYKGLISPVSQSNSIRLRFSGNYYYRHSNRAISPNNYPVITLVPDFKAYYKVTMPTDFKTATQVISEYPSWQYTEGVHKWEGQDLYIQFAYTGTIRITYVPVPAKITSLTQTLEIDDINAMSAAYYLAEHFAMADQNSELASMCRNKFKTLKMESTVKTPLALTQIRDVYNI